MVLEVHQDMLMARNPSRHLNDNPLHYVVERLAQRLTAESGGSQLGALADIAAAAEYALKRQLARDRVSGRREVRHWP